METSDWRTQLPTDVRGNVVKKIIETLKKRTPPSEDPLSQLKKIQSVAQKFEEKVYIDSSDQKEYLRKIMVKLMAAEGSHPNVVSKSSPNPACVGLKASDLGQLVDVQSTDQSQACEAPDQRSLLDVQNDIAGAGGSANLAPACSTVSASAQVLMPSQNPLKLVGNSSGKGIQSASKFKPEQVKQHSSHIVTHPDPHHCRQVKQEYIDPQQNHQQLNPKLSKKVKQEHVASPCIAQQRQVHQQQYNDSQQSHQQLNPNLCKQVKQEPVAPSCIAQQRQVHQQQYIDSQQNHQQLNPNLCKQVKQEPVAPSCIAQQRQVHQQHHHQQELLKHTQQQISQQSVSQAPLLRPSEIHVAPPDCRPDLNSSSKQTSQSVIKNHQQIAFGHTNSKHTPENLLMQSHKQPHVIRSRLTPTNLQQNHLTGTPNGPRDLQQLHHRLPLQHNNLQHQFTGQCIIRSSANHEAQINNMFVLQGETGCGSSDKRQCEIKMQGETRKIASALLPNQVQKSSQPHNRERQLNSPSQPKNMPNLPSSGRMQMSEAPASTYGQGISNVDNLQEELFQKVEILKRKYLAALTRIDEKIACHFQKLHSVPHHPERDNIKKLKAMKHMHYTVKYYIMNLNLPRSKITPACKEKLGFLEGKIVSFLHIFDQRKPATLLEHERTSNVHYMPQSVQLHSQASQDQTWQDENKPQSRSVNTQHGNVTNVVNDSDSSESPILQHDMVHSRQNLTGQNSEKANSLKLVNQVPSESFKLPRSSAQQPNNMLSQNPALRVQSHVHPLDSRINTHDDMHLKLTNEQPNTKTLNQELQRHKSQQQSVQPKQQILQQHHRSSELQCRDLTVSENKNLEPSSRQVPQHSSVSEKKNLPMLPVKPTPVISRSSTKAGISSLVPLASAPVPGEPKKYVLETSLDSNAVYIGGQQSHGAPEAIHCSFDGMNDSEQLPIQRLIKMVNMMSSKALTSCASDIGSVVCMTDRMSGPDMARRSGAPIRDLADMTNYHLQEIYLAQQEMTTRIMKRHRITPISYGASEYFSKNESLLQLSDMEKFDLDLPEISYSKRRRLEVDSLSKEITAINQRLIDTVLDISDEETIPSVASAPILNVEGTIVRCSFIGVAVAPSLKSELVSAPMLPIQPLRVLVPAQYPSCSPIVMDKLKVEVSDDQDLSAKVKSKLSLSLRNLTEPFSLGEIARTWDICARGVISEYAEQNGGGSFSSKYGTWEDCLSAAAA